MPTDPRLLPPPNIPSPNKSFEFKTPPHSASKYELRKNGADARFNMSSEVLRHGLLSPEMSSPQLPIAMMPQQQAIAPAASMVNQERVSSRPLPALEFSRKRSAGAIDLQNSQDQQLIQQQQQHRPAKRSRRLKGPQHLPLPDPSEMTPINFESDAKPPFSYASLIGMALLRAPNRQLTLSQIYHWISSHFRYYKKGEVGWQNSIRHNLSLNKSFEKAEKSKDGKGHYWRIVDGYGYQFCNVEESKRAASSESRRRNRAPTKKSFSGPTDAVPNVLPSMPSLQLPAPTPGVLNGAASTGLAGLGAAQQGLMTLIPQKVDFEFHTQHTPVKLGSIPELTAPSPSFRASAGGDHVLFKSAFFNSPEGSYLQDSPRSGIPFTSSFSSKSSFELSPMRSTDTGPLLEPLTPQKQTAATSVISSGSTTGLTSANNTATNASTANTTALGPISLNSLAKPDDPKFKTPSSVSHTPIVNIGSSSIIRKLWASPSYLEDFYVSPGAAKEASDRALYGSPLAAIKNRHAQNRHSRGNSSGGNGYTTNEIFGIDVCTINCNQQDDLH